MNPCVDSKVAKIPKTPRTGNHLAELDSLRLWLERRYPNLAVEHSRRPPGYSCRESKGPCLEVSWCEGFSSLRLCWRYPGGALALCGAELGGGPQDARGVQGVA